jgi:hypothetical protein
MRARTPRPVAPAVSPTLALHRPATRSALARGPADVVHARSVLGNAAVTAALGGPEPAPSVWAGQMLLEGQSLVGNQAVVNGAATAPVLPGTSSGVPPASAAPPVTPPALEQKKPQPPKPKAPEVRPGAPKTVPPPAAKPEVKDQKDKPPAERQGKEAKKTEAGPRRSPAADPKFQALRKDVNAKKRAVGSSHPPPATEAGAAQAASVPPADDQEARGKAAHAENMDAAEPKAFDKQAFIDAVKKAIADRAPKNLEEADEFGGSGKAEEVKGEVQGEVGEGKESSAKDIAETTAQAPQPAPDKKDVVPMAGDKVPGKPGTPNPSQATPDALPASATDMSEGPAQVDDQMASAQVTEQQLSFENSREPKFDKAVQNKKKMDTHSAKAPGQLRKDESKELKGVKSTAAAQGASAMTSIHGTRVTTGKKVGTGKEGTKSQDEEKRTQVTALLQKVFDKTKCDVEKILSDLDKAVDRQFTDGEKQARDKFTREHEAGMRRYKAERYSAWNGAYLWAKDKLLDLPEEANRIYERARDNYLAAMEQVIKDIAGTVERELNRAKDRISTGRKELKEAVDKLPKDLQAIGREAASDFEGKFDELKDTVNDKGTELVDTLATKYTEAVKSVDEEIAKEKEKNKGLVTKAAEAIGDVIETIKELGRMLMNILRKAASAIGLILKDPIGFLDRLITGVGGGLKLFAKNAGKHLQQGVLAWLLGSGATAGMQMPTTFDILGILLMIAALLGISWPSIRAKLVRRVPNKAVVAAETAIPLVAATKSSGVKGMWPDLKGRVGDLKKNLISDLVSYLLPTIILAGITWIISLFNPASAFIRACKAIIDIVRFIITNARLIIDFVNAVLDAIIAIARGGGGAPAAIEKALAKSIPVLIGALAALLGIGGIAGKVKQVFQKISRPVKRAIDAVVKKITDLVKKLWAKIKPKPKKPKKEDREPTGKPPLAVRPAGRPTRKPDRPRRPKDKDEPGRPRRPRRPTRPDRPRRPKKPDRPTDRPRKDKPRKEEPTKDKTRTIDRRTVIGVEGHTLRAQGGRKRLKILMASEGFSIVMTKLSALRKIAKAELKSGNPQRRARGTGLNQKLDAVETRIDKAVRTYSGMPATQARDLKTNDALNDISEIFRDIGVDYQIPGLEFTRPRHNPVATNTDQYGRALGFAGNPLSRATADHTGTPASIYVPGHNIQGVGTVERGHLLAKQLAGPGNEPKNLSPILKVANTAMKKPEQAVADFIYTGDISNQVVYATQVNHAFKTAGAFQTWLAATYPPAAPDAGETLFDLAKTHLPTGAEINRSMGRPSRTAAQQEHILRALAYYLLKSDVLISITATPGPMNRVSKPASPPPIANSIPSP